MPENRPKLSLSIIIPTHNGLAHLQRCLPSVVRHAPAGTQIVVIDDASTDGSAAWLRSTCPQIELIELAANQGFCHAVNAGLKRAQGDVVELLNNDTEVHAGWADACLKHFDDPTVGSVAPLALRMQPISTNGSDASPDIIDSCGQGYHVCGWAYDRGHGQRLEPRHAQVREVFGPSGSCGFYRRAALERAGYLWPIYGAYFEDTDLAFRLRRAGYRCIFEPASRISHRGSSTYGKGNKRTIWLQSRNEEIVFWANLPWSRLLLGLVPHLGFVTVRSGRKALQRQLGTYLSGKIDVLRHWREIAHRRREIRALAPGGRSRLHLSYGLNVVRDGIVWLAARRCP